MPKQADKKNKNHPKKTDAPRVRPPLHLKKKKKTKSYLSTILISAAVIGGLIVFPTLSKKYNSKKDDDLDDFVPQGPSRNGDDIFQKAMNNMQSGNNFDLYFDGKQLARVERNSSRSLFVQFQSNFAADDLNSAYVFAKIMERELHGELPVDEIIADVKMQMKSKQKRNENLCRYFSSYPKSEVIRDYDGVLPLNAMTELSFDNQKLKEQQDKVDALIHTLINEDHNERNRLRSPLKDMQKSILPHRSSLGGDIKNLLNTNEINEMEKQQREWTKINMKEFVEMTLIPTPENAGFTKWAQWRDRRNGKEIEVDDEFHLRFVHFDDEDNMLNATEELDGIVGLPRFGKKEPSEMQRWLVAQTAVEMSTTMAMIGPLEGSTKELVTQWLMKLGSSKNTTQRRFSASQMELLIESAVSKEAEIAEKERERRFEEMLSRQDDYDARWKTLREKEIDAEKTKEKKEYKTNNKKEMEEEEIDEDISMKGNDEDEQQEENKLNRTVEQFTNAELDVEENITPEIISERNKRVMTAEERAKEDLIQTERRKTELLQRHRLLMLLEPRFVVDELIDCYNAIVMAVNEVSVRSVEVEEETDKTWEEWKAKERKRDNGIPPSPEKISKLLFKKAVRDGKISEPLPEKQEFNAESKTKELTEQQTESTEQMMSNANHQKHEQDAEKGKDDELKEETFVDEEELKATEKEKKEKEKEEDEELFSQFMVDAPNAEDPSIDSILIHEPYPKEEPKGLNRVLTKSFMIDVHNVLTRTSLFANEYDPASNESGIFKVDRGRWKSSCNDVFVDFDEVLKEEKGHPSLQNSEKMLKLKRSCPPQNVDEAVGTLLKETRKMLHALKSGSDSSLSASAVAAWFVDRFLLIRPFHTHNEAVCQVIVSAILMHCGLLPFSPSDPSLPLYSNTTCPTISFHLNRALLAADTTHSLLPLCSLIMVCQQRLAVSALSAEDSPLMLASAPVRKFEFSDEEKSLIKEMQQYRDQMQSIAANEIDSFLLRHNSIERNEECFYSKEFDEIQIDSKTGKHVELAEQLKKSQFPSPFYKTHSSNEENAKKNNQTFEEDSIGWSYAAVHCKFNSDNNMKSNSSSLSSSQNVSYSLVFQTNLPMPLLKQRCLIARASICSEGNPSKLREISNPFVYRHSSKENEMSNQIEKYKKWIKNAFADVFGE
ncbi:uncharacterized protein MONOS_1170 [Monocercomonoides exilis]|uniref:uncharacterized protein n=1 Tax=Monocercomonoides exilis TaxID=2049356 RepID=UPI00355A212C|nr:hypothetical protein MONOS_1170 [Monocercomonoides exilis]|eukprot:MONOS_1170.1-p1 / transcript=MONOS_1170.1 / gene=MONOS_1170 / organism=Monocercomonoides_exilis_PA203 / gene_product=unspecified product / transcript_product=unspecified product / location=Mono_scaffold00020:15457-18972(-) / protein_length=1172 / sequence_SO=supercontig / SO=protein_coding / is_pseudo=false